MRCPSDGVELVMAERQGVEIDYCPSCRGIWLDRGELDKILERAATAAPGPGAVPGGPAGGWAGDGGWEAAPGPAHPGGYPADQGYGGQAYPGPGYADRGYDPRRDDRYDDRRPSRKRRRESWLEDLFDFD